MNEKSQQLIADWAIKSGRTVDDLTSSFNNYVLEFQQAVPNKEAAYYEDLATRKLFLEVKVDMQGNAKPYDMIVLGVGDCRDVTANDKAEKEALFLNTATRAQAIAEKKVDNEGNALDTNPWMIKPDEAKGIKGRANPNYGKPIKPLPTRNIIAFGRPANGGSFKLINIVARNEAANATPAVKGTFRARINIKDDSGIIVAANAGKVTKYTPIVLPEYDPVDDQKICNILAEAPAEIAPSFVEMPLWIEERKSGNLLAIVCGDATRIGEPTVNGSVLVVLDDPTSMNLEAEGLPVWVPKDLVPQVDFGPTSRVYAIGRPSMGAGYNKETHSMDNSMQRPQLNALAIFADPLYRVAPEEAAPISEPIEAQ